MIAISVIAVRLYIKTIKKNISVFTKAMKSSSVSLKEVDMNQVGYDDFDELIVVTNSMTKRINHLLFHDELTGLLNRRFITQKLVTLLEEKQVNSLAVMMVDIDLFKRVNDTYGHQVGDKILIEITKIIEERLNELQESNDFCIGRYGGEEFLILLKNISKEEAIVIANDLLTTVENMKFDCIEDTITISIGLAFSIDLSADEIIKISDDNLYKAKESGRNKAVI
jgi:diguanylate cyclase (GGDEF)-like protein